MRRKKLKAPPPTPEGMVWRTDQYGTRLVPASDAHEQARRKMAMFDAQPVFIRRKQYGESLIHYGPEGWKS